MRVDIKGEGSQGENTRGSINTLRCPEEEAGLGADRGPETCSPAALGSVGSGCERNR